MESACSEEFSLRIFLSYRGGGRGNFSSGRHRIHRDDFSSGIFGGRAEAGDCGGMDSGRDCEPEIKCRGAFISGVFFALCRRKKQKNEPRAASIPSRGDVTFRHRQKGLCRVQVRPDKKTQPIRRAPEGNPAKVEPLLKEYRVSRAPYGKRPGAPDSIRKFFGRDEVRHASEDY